ncbi:hypothetical protein [Methylomonas rhizoryzae]|uniref:hypothetical protein n=1 Tax=Methylomonas rhizoryzae TaxID=2608981 RepID=UPI00123222C8|nr:hypothetical protein [Methylomonas rhizoryzae]
MDFCQKTSDNNEIGVPFRFSRLRSEWPAVAGKEYMLGPDGGIRKVVHGSIARGLVQTISVTGLREFADHIGGYGESDCIILGRSDFDDIALCTERQPVEGAIARTRANFPLRDEPLLVFFDLDRPTGEPLADVLEYVTTLRSIYPPLLDVGFMCRGSASAGVYRPGVDEVPTVRTGGVRLYWVLRSGLMLGHFASSFADVAWLNGWGRVKITASGHRRYAIYIDETTEIDLSVFAPERIDFCGANPCRDGVARVSWPVEYVGGGALSELWSLTPGQMAQAEAARAAAYADAEGEAREVARQWREGRGAAAPKAIRRQVVETLRRVDSTEVSRTGLPVVRITGGHELDFEGVGVVDVLDVLRDPDRYDEMLSLDPVEPHRGWKGAFYAARRQIFSFACGGYLARLSRVEVVYDSEYPLRTMSEVDAVLCAGRYPDLYMRGGEVVQVSREGDIRPVSRELLAILIGRLVDFRRWEQRRDGSWECVAMQPTPQWWAAYATRIDCGLPGLRGVRSVPYLSDDGQVIRRRGFAGGLYLTEGWPGVPEVVPATREAALEAVREVLHPVRGFTFESRRDPAVWLAACLAAIQRPLLGNVPMVVITATAPGSGKTLLAQCLATLVEGRQVPGAKYLGDSDESDKSIVSMLCEGKQLILLDNINARLGGDTLCGVLTSEVYTGRLLGASRMLRLPTDGELWLATGNNVQYLPDMPRRVVEIRLDPRCERPEAREFDFSPVEEIAASRERLLTCLLTMLRAWRASGEASRCRPMGSYDRFVAEIGGCVHWLTGIDIAEAVPAAVVVDEEAAALAELLATWRDEVGVVPATVPDALGVAGLRSWGVSYYPDGRGGVNLRSAGRYVARHAGRVVDGMRLVRAGAVRRVVQWRLDMV